MRKVEKDEIHRMSGNHQWENLSVEYFTQHIPDRYKLLCSYIHHVDTWFSENSKGEKCWRVQGYILIRDFPALKDLCYYMLGNFDAFIGIGEDCLELWTLVVPFKE